MDRAELIGYMREMFAGDGPGEKATVAELIDGMKEGGEIDVTAAEVRVACDDLWAEGMLDRLGADTYGLSVKYLEEREAEEAEWFAGAIAEHELKRIARK